jgi:hypothetical protein
MVDYEGVCLPMRGASLPALARVIHSQRTLIHWRSSRSCLTTGRVGCHRCKCHGRDTPTLVRSTWLEESESLEDCCGERCSKRCGRAFRDTLALPVLPCDFPVPRGVGQWIGGQFDKGAEKRFDGYFLWEMGDGYTLRFIQEPKAAYGGALAGPIRIGVTLSLGEDRGGLGS